MKAVAQIISVLFHPLILTVYAFLYVMWINPYSYGGWMSGNMILTLIQVTINAFLFPVIAVLLMRALGFVSSLELPTREERFIPFISTTIFYIWTYFVFKRSDNPEVLSDILLAASMGIVIAFLVLIFKNKISLHAIGAGLFFSLAFNTFNMSQFNVIPIIFGVVLIAGLVGASRLFLKAHEPREVYVGFAMGMLCMNIALLL